MPSYWGLSELWLTLLLSTAAGFTALPHRNQQPIHVRLQQALHNEAATAAGDTSTATIYCGNKMKATATTINDTSTPKRLSLPLRKAWSAELRFALEAALAECATSTDVFEDIRAREASSSGGADGAEWLWQCRVPAFGDNCRVLLRLQNEVESHKLPYLVLSLEESEGRDDFAWIAKKLWESSDGLELAGLDCCESLRQVVVQLCNELPPDPGLDAATVQWTTQQERQFEGLMETTSGSAKDLSKTLDEDGYAVIDTSLLTHANKATQDKLSEYLIETTSQGENVRTDRVHFLDNVQALDCGIGPQFNLLMGIAHYLNRNPRRDLEPSSQPSAFSSGPYQQPVLPATTAWPLTVPKLIQFAEYGKDDFYTAHSDNSLTDEVTPSGDRIRSNFRKWTCILYLNDDNNWDINSDGGALRLYPRSQDFESPGQAKRHGYGSLDVNPTGLLIFDSKLVHSVEPVLSCKVRRALTLWINNPNNSGVRGETFY